MSSLSTHLREAANHADLRFHPSCPICRQERLAGPLPANALVTHRTLAALTAGLLAVSAGAPPVAAAAGEPDQEQTGATEPGSSTDSAGNPATDPGGSANTAPDTGAGPSTQPDDPDSGPPDPEPAKDDPLIEDQGDEPSPNQRQSGTTGKQTPGPARAPAGAGAVAPTSPTSIASPLPAIQMPKPAPAHRRAHAPDPHRRVPTGISGVTTPLGTSSPEIQTSAPSPPVQPDFAAVTSPVSPTSNGGHARATRTSRSAREHVVRPGESLWSIARDQLGRGASNADIAREVHRLWELNAKVIATGNPDLLPVGTKLRLR